MNILITGATGLVGQRLSRLLLRKGHSVSWLSRNKSSTNDKVQHFVWNVNEHYIDEKAFENIDAVVHLAGAGIADKPWTEERKKEIVDSRIQSTQLLYTYLSNLTTKPKVVVASSAIGYYGSVTQETVFTETDPPANDFLGKCCAQWENEIFKIENLGIRTVALRTGIVLSKQGGALPKMAKPISLGLGAALGNGKQYMSWIHIDDLCNLYVTAIENEKYTGSYNAVTSNPTSNKRFTQALASILQKPYFLPNVPTFLLKLIFGEMAIILLEGSRISAQKVIENGYKFKFNYLDEALKDLYPTS